MPFSPLADMSRRIPDGGRYNPRNSAISGFGLHHNAGVDAFGEASNPAREVSANYWITNAGVIIPNVDEAFRAWTSGAAGYPAGAAADHRNITVEISNSPEGVRDGSWAISDAAMNALIALIADVYRRYNLGPVTRGANRGIGIHQDWVPTSCPGPYVVSKLGHIISEAERLRVGGPVEEKEEEDPMPKKYDRKQYNPKQVCKPGEWTMIYVNKAKDASVMFSGPKRREGDLHVGVVADGEFQARFAIDTVTSASPVRTLKRSGSVIVNSIRRRAFWTWPFGLAAKGKSQDQRVRVLVRPVGDKPITVSAVLSRARYWEE